MRETGINQIYTKVPFHFISAKEYSKFIKITKQERLEFENKLKKGLGCKKKAILFSDETKFNLASKVVEEYFDLYNNFSGGKFEVVSEGSIIFDDSKSGASALLTNKKIPKNVIVQDRKQACVSGMLALIDAFGFYKTFNENTIVVTIDATDYSLSDGRTALTAPFTAGAGSIVIEVGEGKLLKFIGSIGKYSSSQKDFLIPQGQKYPEVYGSYSFLSYLTHVGEAFLEMKNKDKLKLSDFKLFAFHTPYPSMAEYSLLYLNQLDRGDYSTYDTLCKELPYDIDEVEDIGVFEKYLSDNVIHSVKNNLIENFTKEEIKDKYASLFDKLSPSLIFSSQVGNLYTGASPLAIASALSYGEYDVGDKLLSIGYGSGASSVAMQFEITPFTKEIVSKWDIIQRLENRIAVSAEEYEKSLEKFA